MTGFLALLSTVNGGGIARFLSDHKTSLGWKYVKSISIVHDPAPGLGIDLETSTRPTAFWLLWEVAEHPPNTVKRAERDQPVIYAGDSEGFGAIADGQHNMRVLVDREFVLPNIDNMQELQSKGWELAGTAPLDRERCSTRTETMMRHIYEGQAIPRAEHQRWLNRQNPAKLYEFCFSPAGIIVEKFRDASPTPADWTERDGRYYNFDDGWSDVAFQAYRHLSTQLHFNIKSLDTLIFSDLDTWSSRLIEWAISGVWKRDPRTQQIAPFWVPKWSSRPDFAHAFRVAPDNGLHQVIMGTPMGARVTRFLDDHRRADRYTPLLGRKTVREIWVWWDGPHPHQNCRVMFELGNGPVRG